LGFHDRPDEVRVNAPEGRCPRRRPASPAIERVLGIKGVDQDAAEQVTRDHHWSNSSLKISSKRYQVKMAFSHLFPSG
jgi:hypothetical protein